MAHSCGFSGHRPQRFPWRFHETAPACAALKAALKEQVLLLTRSGTTDFYSGMALGVDTWAAEAVLELRGKYPSIKLHCVLPCKNQDAKWNAAAKETYQTILAQADSIQYVSQFYFNGCMLKRDQKLVELSSLLLAVYDGQPSGGTAATIRYAREQGKGIICIDPISLVVTEDHVEYASF